jgi:hypothetical protein
VKASPPFRKSRASGRILPLSRCVQNISDEVAGKSAPVARAGELRRHAQGPASPFDRGNVQCFPRTPGQAPSAPPNRNEPEAQAVPSNSRRRPLYVGHWKRRLSRHSWSRQEVAVGLKRFSEHGDPRVVQNPSHACKPSLQPRSRPPRQPPPPAGIGGQRPSPSPPTIPSTSVKHRLG